jgi:hypothetical protein
MATKKLERAVTKANSKIVAAEKAAPAVKKISKLNTKNMRSILGDSAEEIQQLLETNDSDSATMLLQKRLLQSLTDMIPMTEHAIRKSKGTRNVYQFNSLVTSLREILIDIQSTKDRGALGDALVEKIIRPSFLDIGMLLVQEDARVTADAKDLLDPKAFKEFKRIKAESLQRTAEFIQKQYLQVKDQSIAFLQR